MTILKVTNLSKRFSNHDILQDVNILIEEPGIYAVIGPNGSGKTTLFNIISNLLKPTNGEIEILGKKNTDSSIFYDVSFLKDNTVLYDYLTGYDHLSFINNVQKLTDNRIDEVIDQMQIRSYINKKVGNYSLGMKQHLLISMAMLNKPKLMILDEPLNGLDPSSVIKVRKLLKDLSKSGTTILISSHTLSEIDLLTDKIFFLKNGRIIEEKIDLNSNNYKIVLSENEIIKFNNIDREILKAYDLVIDGDIIEVQLKGNKLSDFINILHNNQINYIDILKIKLGTEERYKKVFQEEIK